MVLYFEEERTYNQWLIDSEEPCHDCRVFMLIKATLGGNFAQETLLNIQLEGYNI